MQPRLPQPRPAAAIFNSITYYHRRQEEEECIQRCMIRFFILFERSELLIDTSQKKSARVPVCRVHVCTCAIILVLVCGIMYRIRTYRYQLVISRLPRYVYVDTYVPGWGTYYVPHMFVNWCEHVCLYLVSAGSQDTYM